MITTTLKKIAWRKISLPVWHNLMAALGKTEADDEAFPFAKIFEVNGLEEAVWSWQRITPQYAREQRLFAVFCARQIQHLMTDPRCIAAIDVAERYANGEATEKELSMRCWDAWDVCVDARIALKYANGPDTQPHDRFFIQRVFYSARAATAASTSHLEKVPGEAMRSALAAMPEIKPVLTAEFIRICNETEEREG